MSFNNPKTITVIKSRPRSCVTNLILIHRYSQVTAARRLDDTSVYTSFARLSCSYSSVILMVLYTFSRQSTRLSTHLIIISFYCTAVFFHIQYTYISNHVKVIISGDYESGCVGHCTVHSRILSALFWYQSQVIATHAHERLDCL